jgi:hypothetical protein
MTREFELEHEGEAYWVEVEFRTIRVDDSFDGHLAGRVHTFEASHREADIDSLEVVSCTDGAGEEVHVDDDLMAAIAGHVGEMDLGD